MIRRLRRKLVAITSVLLTALLLLILVFVYVITGSQMERDSVETLERTASIMVRPDGGADPDRRPVFPVGTPSRRDLRGAGLL